MANLSIALFTSVTASPSNVLPLVSDTVKGAGYNGQTNALHTVQYTIANNFTGIIKMQGTLATTPVEADWSDVSPDVGDGVTPITPQIIVANFGGNYVWIRSVITNFELGSLTSVLYTHN